MNSARPARDEGEAEMEDDERAGEARTSGGSGSNEARPSTARSLHPEQDRGADAANAGRGEARLDSSERARPALRPGRPR